MVDSYRDETKEYRFDEYALFGKAVALGFGAVGTLSSMEALIVSLSYTFQLFFDFSGYCDMAMGIGYLFNVELPINFNSP